MFLAGIHLKKNTDGFPIENVGNDADGDGCPIEEVRGWKKRGPRLVGFIRKQDFKLEL